MFRPEVYGISSLEIGLKLKIIKTTDNKSGTIHHIIIKFRSILKET